VLSGAQILDPGVFGFASPQNQPERDEKNGRERQERDQMIRAGQWLRNLRRQVSWTVSRMRRGEVRQKNPSDDCRQRRAEFDPHGAKLSIDP
jgi:hypothetical protein